MDEVAKSLLDKQEADRTNEMIRAFARLWREQHEDLCPTWVEQVWANGTNMAEIPLRISDFFSAVAHHESRRVVEAVEATRVLERERQKDAVAPSAVSGTYRIMVESTCEPGRVGTTVTVTPDHGREPEEP